ncbi:hypothetical protein HUA76_02185 [Myxococcus sp. CA056]|uniref:hypothetical protein n=1 Tax=Myxococcus sp. CA056 TaxID=2741740 RepID=UPI00157B24E1|nr:hypothetical protein [Myxococcus sp. CA056]NTX09581.1 hypothetical protein [Myxococcus sp. CA056]
MNLPPPGFDGPFDVYFSQFIEPNLPSPEAVLVFHDELRRYVEESDPIFFLRQMEGAEPWRRRGNLYPPQMASGGRVAFTDNSPQWALHALAYRNALPRGLGFSMWLREQMPCHIYDVNGAKLGETLNSARWHAAHIVDVKDGNTTWRSWNRDELVRRFIRNVHPCNLLLLPLSDWARLGKQKDLLHFALDRYRERYGRVLDEALAWMGESAPQSHGIPTIRYKPVTAVPDMGPNTLVLCQSSEGRIHMTGFGTRFAGQEGRDKFSVAVTLLDGTVFGPLGDVSALDVLTRLDFKGDHFRNNKYYSNDYFRIEQGSLLGKTVCAQGLAERLNTLRRRSAF